MGCINTILQKQKLNKLTYDNTPFLEFTGKFLWAKCIDVYDGDTVTIAFMLHKHPYKVRCRLAELDTAEVRTKNLQEKTHGIKARERVKELILDKVVHIHAGSWDKYGRLLVWIRLTPKSKTINEILIDEKLGYYYDGKKKREFADWYKIE